MLNVHFTEWCRREPETPATSHFFFYLYGLDVLPYQVLLNFIPNNEAPFQKNMPHLCSI